MQDLNTYTVEEYVELHMNLWEEKNPDHSLSEAERQLFVDVAIEKLSKQMKMYEMMSRQGFNV